MRTYAIIGDRRGSAVVEFAMLTPVLCMIFAGLFDLGNLVYTRERLSDAVNTAANYALVQAAAVNSTSGVQLASDLARITSTAGGSSWADSAVSVNNGPAASGVVTSPTVVPVPTASGTPANADSYYCPTASTPLTWGNAVASRGTACASGGIGGKFVTIKASRRFVPLFTGYGYVANGIVSQSTVVQVQ